jgi:hypothetical protein
MLRTLTGKNLKGSYFLLPEKNQDVTAGQRGIPSPVWLLGRRGPAQGLFYLRPVFSFCFILFQKNASSYVACKIHNFSSRCPFEVVQLALCSMKCLDFIKNVKL